MEKYGASRKAGRLGEYRARHHSTSGGDRETEVNELQVNPTAAPRMSRVAITVTPVG